MTLHNNLPLSAATRGIWLSLWYMMEDCCFFVFGLCSLLLQGFLCYCAGVWFLCCPRWLPSVMISAIVLFAIAPMLCLMFAHVMDSVLQFEVPERVCGVRVWPHKCLEVKGSFRIVFPKEFLEFFEEACQIVHHNCREEARLMLRLQQALADSGLVKGLYEGLHLLRSFWLVWEDH
jgi:hypothetical protein